MFRYNETNEACFQIRSVIMPVKMAFTALQDNFNCDIGFVCPIHHNPADFFLDIVGGDVNTAQLIKRMNAAAANAPTADDHGAVTCYSEIN